MAGALSDDTNLNLLLYGLAWLVDLAWLVGLAWLAFARRGVSG